MSPRGRISQHDLSPEICNSCRLSQVITDHTGRNPRQSLNSSCYKEQLSPADCAAHHYTRQSWGMVMYYQVSVAMPVHATCTTATLDLHLTYQSGADLLFAMLRGKLRSSNYRLLSSARRIIGVFQAHLISNLDFTTTLVTLKLNVRSLKY